MGWSARMAETVERGAQPVHPRQGHRDTLALERHDEARETQWQAVEQAQAAAREAAWKQVRDSAQRIREEGARVREEHDFQRHVDRMEGINHESDLGR